MKAKEIAKQLFEVRTQLYKAKISGRPIDVSTFSQFKLHLQQLKQALTTQKDGNKKDQIIAQLLQCFNDDKYLGTAGYSNIHSAFGDNKSSVGNQLLEYLAQYEKQHPDKILHRDYQNYIHQKIPEGQQYFNYQINYLIDLIFKGQDFNAQQALQLGQVLHHYTGTTPIQKEDIDDTVASIVISSKLYILSRKHQQILKRAIQTFLQKPSEKGVLQVLRMFAQPSRLDYSIQYIHDHRNSIITVAALSALAFVGKKTYDLWNDPFLSDTSKKVTYYESQEHARENIQKYNAFYDTVQNGRYRHQMSEVDEEEIKNVLSISEIKDNRKKNTQLFFDKLPKYNGIGQYIGSDSISYFFTQEDINQAHTLIDNYDMRELQECLNKLCQGIGGSLDPEELLQPILTNISFFPLGKKVAGIQTNYSKTNKIILINTSFITSHGKPDYNLLTQVLFHELIHAVFGHKPFIIATEGKTDRYTDYYLYETLRKDCFSSHDAYAEFKVADGLYTMNIYTDNSNKIAGSGFYRSFYPHSNYNEKVIYPSPEDVDGSLQALVDEYNKEPSPDLFRAIKATKVYQLLQKYPDHIINPKLFLAVIDDEAGAAAANLQGLVSGDNADIFNLTPKTLSYIRQIISQYKKSKDYRHFHDAKTPQQWISYFEKVKESYVGKQFNIDANTPYKPGINRNDDDSEEKEGGIPRGLIITMAAVLLSGFIVREFIKNGLKKTTIAEQLANKADVKTLKADAGVNSVDGLMGLAGLLYLSLTSISVAHFIFQKDIANITQTAIGFFALYALARLRRIAVQYKEKYINELSDTLETSRALMHKTHLLSDLLDHNRSALQGYKKQWYNIIEETAPRSYIDINSYKSQDETTDQLTKTIFVSKAVSEPIPERIISNIYSVLGIATQPNKRYEATHGDFKTIGIGDKIEGRINRKKTAQQQNKLVIMPYEYKPSEPKPTKKGTILVSICLDIHYDQNVIDSINEEYRKRKNHFKDGKKAIDRKTLQRQQEKIQEVANYIRALCDTREMSPKHIKVALTLDGKMIEVLNPHSMSPSDIRKVVSNIYDLHFQNHTLRTYQGFNDEQFFADHLETFIPEEVVSIGYKSSPKSFGHQVKDLKQKTGASSTVHIIDHRGDLIKDYDTEQD